MHVTLFLNAMNHYTRDKHQQAAHCDCVGAFVAVILFQAMTAREYFQSQYCDLNSGLNTKAYTLSRAHRCVEKQ